MKCYIIVFILLVNQVLCRAPGVNKNGRWNIKRHLFQSITRRLGSSKTPLTAKDFVDIDVNKPNEDSFLAALEHSRLPCKLLADPLDCNEPSYLYPQDSADFDALCQFNKCLTGADYLNNPNQHKHMYSPLDVDNTFTRLAIVRIEKGTPNPSHASGKTPSMRFSIQFIRNKKKQQ